MQRVVAAERTFPNLRFSFTIATLGGNSPNSLNQLGAWVIPDVATLSAYAAQRGLAGIHFWSFDRDNDCPAGAASPTCNSYGQAGRLGFTSRFLSSLGQ